MTALTEKNTLVEKILRAREHRVEVGKFTIIVRRPSWLEWMEMGKAPKLSAPLQCVVGWEGVTEADLVPGGDPHPLPFDRDACIEWLSDQETLGIPVAEAVIKAFEEHKARMQAAKKN